MCKKFFLLFLAGIMAVSACGTFEVSLEGTPTPTLPTETLTQRPTARSGILLTATRTPALTRTLTPALTSVPPCDLAQFVADVSVPDGTNFKPLETFTKTWRLKNVGSCTWTTQYALVFVSGEAMLVPEPKPLLGSVAPGEMVDVSVNLTAPQDYGVYNGYWGLENASEIRLPVMGSSDGTFYVNIKVAPEFAGFKVSVDSLTVSCQKSDSFTATAVISSNGPGVISYRLAYGGSEPPPPTTLTFDNAATKTVTRDIPFSAVVPSHPELAWVQILVSGPNQEIVGDRVPLLCP